MKHPATTPPMSLLVSVPSSSAQGSPGCWSMPGTHFGLPQRTPLTCPVSEGALESPRVSWGWEELALLDQGLEMDTGWHRPIGSTSLPWVSQHLLLSDILTDVCLWLLSECKSQEGKYLWSLLWCQLLPSLVAYSRHSISTSICGRRKRGTEGGRFVGDTTYPGERLLLRPFTITENINVRPADSSCSPFGCPPWP